MLISIPEVLPAPRLTQSRGLLAGAGDAWVDGRVSASYQGAPVKFNRQIDERSAVAQACQQIVLGALERHPFFISAVLPNEVYPPMPRRAQVRTEPARLVAWPERPSRADRGDRAARAESAGPRLTQPERWSVDFGGPQATIQAEAWAGNRSASIRKVDNGIFGTLINLHKGIGMPVTWILLIDTLAGSLIQLSVSGLALWVLTHRRRAVGLAIFASGLAATVGLAVSRL